jgi:hypothetical protein
VDQNINNSLNEPLWTLLANPANDAYLYANNLQALVNDFPQSGILQALLARASDEKNLRHASVYFNAKSLYKLINSPSAFAAVPDEKIIIQTGIRANGHYQKNERQEADDHQPAIEHEVNQPLNVPVADTDHLLEATSRIEEDTTVEVPIENKAAETNEVVPSEVISTINELEPIDKNHVDGPTDAPVEAHTDELSEQGAEKGISDEIFDEIVGIEHINIEPEASQPATAAVYEEVKAQDETVEPLAIINEAEIKAQDETPEPLPIINEEEVKTQDERVEPSPIINEEEVRRRMKHLNLYPL